MILLKFRHITPSFLLLYQKVKYVIKSLKPKPTSRYDEISASLLNKDIMNLSFMNGQFSEVFKISIGIQFIKKVTLINVKFQTNDYITYVI